MATDGNMVMAKYLHPNRGQHSVVGGVTKMKYGFRGGGDSFLVHIDDVRANPHLFEEIKTQAAPAKAQAPAPASPIAPPEPQVIEEESVPPPDVITGAEAPSKEVNIVGRLPGVTAPIAELLAADGIESADQVLALGIDGLMEYKGIGRVKAEGIIEATTQLREIAARA